LVAAFERNTHGQLVTLNTTPTHDTQGLGTWLQGAAASSTAPVSARFMLPGGGRFVLTATLGLDVAWPGATVDARLAWQGDHVDAWPPGVIAFVHLRQAETNLQQQDGLPRYFVIDPLPAAGKWADWRQLTVPLDAAPAANSSAAWHVVVGLYDPVQGTRLSVVDVDGNVIGDEVIVGTLARRDAPVADQSCALIPATCASQGVK
jgi:hypothetical protein